MEKLTRCQLIEYCKKNDIKKYSRKTNKNIIKLINKKISSKEIYIPERPWEIIMQFCKGYTKAIKKKIYHDRICIAYAIIECIKNYPISSISDYFDQFSVQEQIDHVSDIWTKTSLWDNIWSDRDFQYIIKKTYYNVYKKYKFSKNIKKYNITFSNIQNNIIYTKKHKNLWIDMITPYIIRCRDFYGIKYIQNATLTFNLKYLTDIIHAKNKLEDYKNIWATYMIDESVINEKIIIINGIFFMLIELNYFTMQLKFKKGLKDNSNIFIVKVDSFEEEEIINKIKEQLS